MCGGLQDNGNWCGPSRSKAGSILTDDWYTVSGGDGFYTVPVPGKPNIVYSNAQGGYFHVTDTDTGRSREIEPYPRMIGSQGQGMYQAKYRFNWDAPIHISPHDPSVTYWGGNVLFRSPDEFYTFEVISPDLTNDDPEKLLDSGGEIYNDNTAAEFHATILTIAESPAERGVIWVGTDDGNVQVTRRRRRRTGRWSTRTSRTFPPRRGCQDRRVAPRRRARLHQRRPAPAGRLHAARLPLRRLRRRCVDLSAGLPQDDYTKVIREDPKNPNVLYVGMEQGLQFSIDGGTTWHDLRLNLPRVSVRDIKVHPRDNDLIIGTHGRGAWILDDIAPIQGLADAMSASCTLFDVRRATRWESWSKDSNLGTSTWQGENPPAGAFINYYLAADASPVTITIADARRRGGEPDDGPRPRRRQPRHLEHDLVEPGRHAAGGGRRRARRRRRAAGPARHLHGHGCGRRAAGVEDARAARRPRRRPADGRLPGAVRCRAEGAGR